MHPLDKIKFTAFDGETDIHGTNRGVTFMAADGDEPSVLIIKGLKLEDAYHVLDHLRGGLLKDADNEPTVKAAAPTKARVDNTDTVTEKPTTKAERDARGPIDFAKKAKEAKEAKAREAATVKEPEPEQLELPLEDEGTGDVDADDEAGELDVAAMSKMEKLREVIEYMVEAGHDTADKIVEVARRYKGDVPLLRLVEEKGGFDKRMERNALVVLAGRPSN